MIGARCADLIAVVSMEFKASAEDISECHMRILAEAVKEGLQPDTDKYTYNFYDFLKKPSNYI
jgi:hypothetical protein